MMTKLKKAQVQSIKKKKRIKCKRVKSIWKMVNVNWASSAVRTNQMTICRLICPSQQIQQPYNKAQQSIHFQFHLISISPEPTIYLSHVNYYPSIHLSTLSILYSLTHLFSILNLTNSTQALTLLYEPRAKILGIYPSWLVVQSSLPVATSVITASISHHHSSCPPTTSSTRGITRIWSVRLHQSYQTVASGSTDVLTSSTTVRYQRILIHHLTSSC